MMPRDERARRAFTLIEIGVVLAIIGVLVALASTAYDSYIERVRVLRAVIEIKNMATELEGYLATGGSLPPTLADAGRGTPKDPWGHSYAYLPLFGKKLPDGSARPPGASGGAGQGGGGGQGGGAGQGGGSPGGGGGQGQGGGGGGPAGGGAAAQARKDRFLVPLNTDFDLYSVGRDGESVPALTAAKSRDDVVRAANGSFIGLASKF
jgi:general secretion pathway protein G